MTGFRWENGPRSEGIAALALKKHASLEAGRSHHVTATERTTARLERSLTVAVLTDAVRRGVEFLARGSCPTVIRSQ
jgi:hypothetical protein